MMDSVNTPFPQCVDYLVENIELDPGFKDYLRWAQANKIPTVILSGGMTPIITAIMKKLVGDEVDQIDIVCNDVQARPGMSIEQEGGWDIKFHDESGFGHDKSLTIRPYAQLPADQRPWMFYAGDGVSDLSAARETDLLFAKEGRDLVSYCVKENVPFTTFNDWSSILATVKEIVEGKTSIQDAAREGFEKFKGGATSNGHAK
ncbi:HAD-like domain-containing protein [Neohortaea acidophila]|uniref:HAD-like domain-containing protein n=1 Tax=Neohortaea acidophila TaxID=245834 RepID=A0A6A6PS18_9PEZI|nr:HAD-like domain-containing protein [Neohortaea acidophila]KAF2482899.1 HAD-like domain-containing protein [Neohortaea acidophila]